MSGQSALADPEAVANPQAKLDQLQEKAERLAEEYQGELVTLNDAEHAAERAAKRAREVKRKLGRARRQVGQLAAEKYMRGPISPGMTVLMSGEPHAVLDRASTAHYLAQHKVRQINEMQELAAEARKAQRQARARVQEVRREIAEMEQNREKVQRLIDRYQSEAAARAERTSSSTSSSSSSLPAPGNITPRMAQVRSEIVSKFGEGYGVGCYRPDDSGEHPLGRACDFMLSSGGAVPSSSQVERGYAIAEWARANAERLGIMYVIYRQRIWDIRCGCGWESMEDRGSVTANHVDHVHISVF